MLALDNASVRLARSHVHTGLTERLPFIIGDAVVVGDPCIVVNHVVSAFL